MSADQPQTRRFAARPLRLAACALSAAILVTLGALPLASGAAASEVLKLVVSPSSLSLAKAATPPAFTVNVSGRASKAVDVAIYSQLVELLSCASTAGVEMTRKGASQLQPVPATPGHPQRFPANPVNFKGSFDWHGEVVVSTGTAPRGTYPVCGYMLAAGAPSSSKPLALAAASSRSPDPRLRARKAFFAGEDVEVHELPLSAMRWRQEGPTRGPLGSPSVVSAAARARSLSGDERGDGADLRGSEGLGEGGHALAALSDLVDQVAVGGGLVVEIRAFPP